MHGTPTNAEIARLRELGRRRRSRSEAGRFLVEGPKLVAEALRSSLAVVDVVVSDEWLDQSPHDTHDVARLADTRGVPVRSVPMNRIDRIATTASAQPVVAEVELPATGWESWPADQSPATALAFMVAVDVNDPGNLGTIARSAVAAGFDAVVALGDCADPFGPKSVRAAAGAVFHAPVIVDRIVANGMQKLAELGAHRVGTRMADAVPCDQADFTPSLALVLGNEAHGLGAQVDPLIDQWVSVPMQGPVESLNVAMAATVLSYEVSRQRNAQ